MIVYGRRGVGKSALLRRALTDAGFPFLYYRAERRTLPLPDLHISEVGIWWGAKDIEIDVVALDERGKLAVAGSCKWTNEPMDVREYAALLADLNRAGLAATDAAETPHIFLFSRSGFTPRLNEIAAGQSQPRLSLVTVPDMYSV